MVLKKECINDPDIVSNSISNCVAGMYDYNGVKQPNTISQDIISFNGASFGCLAKNNQGKCYILSAYKSNSNNYLDSRQKELYDKYIAIPKTYISRSGFAQDYWVYAMIRCQEEGGHLPTRNELNNLVKIIYKNVDAVNSGYNASTYADIDTDSQIYQILKNALGATEFSIWASAIKSGSDDYTRSGAYSRSFKKKCNNRN